MGSCEDDTGALTTFMDILIRVDNCHSSIINTLIMGGSFVAHISPVSSLISEDASEDFSPLC